MATETTAVNTEEKKAPVADPIVIPPFTVLRNTIDGEFSQHKITRGDKADTFYPAPVINEANVKVWCEWIGWQAIAGISQSFMKRISQGWYKQACNNAEKTFDLEVFKKNAASFSVIGETMKVLSTRLRELQNELAKLNVAEIMMKGQDSPEVKAFIALAQRIQSVHEAIENKRRPDDDDEAEDKNAEPISSV